MSSDDEVTPGNQFTGFDAQPVAKLNRVAAVGGGSATDKHRENRASAQNCQGASTVKASGIVDQSASNSIPAGVEGLPAGGDLGSFGAHGKKSNKRQTTSTRTAPPVSVPGLSGSTNEQSASHHRGGHHHAGHSGHGAYQPLNAKGAEDMERRMREDLAKATEQAKGANQEDVFEAEYAALHIQPPAPPVAPATSNNVTEVADDDFDF